MALSEEQKERLKKTAAERAAQIRSGQTTKNAGEAGTFSGIEERVEKIRSGGYVTQGMESAAKKDAESRIHSYGQEQNTTAPQVTAPAAESQAQTQAESGYKTWSGEDQTLLRDYVDNRIHYDENMAALYTNAEAKLYAKYGKETVQAMAQLYSKDRQAETTAADEAVAAKDMEEIGSWSQEDQQLLADYVNNRYYWDADSAESWEAARTALWAKYGKERVQELAETYIRQQNQQNAERVADDVDSLTQTTGGKILGSALAVGANVMGGITGTAGYLENLLTGTGRYSTLDPNAVGTELQSFGSRVTGNVAESIRGEKEEGQGITWGDVGATVYTAGMSALENLARIALTGGTSSLALAATGSFSQSVRQASAQGATPTEAVALGIISGGLEVLTEKVSLDNLLSQAGGGYATFKEAVKRAFLAGAVEVSEEELNFVCSTLAEAAILKDKSGYSQQIQELVAGGMSYEEAKEQANRALVSEAFQTAVQSFLSGGMMSGATTAFTNLVTGRPTNTDGAATAETENPAGNGGEAAVETEQTAGAEDPEARPEYTVEMAERMDPVKAALNEYRTKGTVSNRLAEMVLGNSEAMEWLKSEAGAEITGTKSERRNAVKAAVEALAAQQKTARAEAMATPEAVKQKQWAQRVNAAMNQATGKTAQTAEQVEAANVAQDNGSGIKEQIRANQEQLNTMQPVAEIQTPKEFSNMNISEKINWVVEKLRPTNYKVDRKGFGIINFSAKQLKSAFNYFTKGGAEEAVFEAIPYVLENGTEISSHGDHKGRGYTTVTFAAPVNVNGKRGNMAVVVKQTTDNYYKVHRILSPDGSVFELSDTAKAEPTPAGESPETGSLATPISSASAEEGVNGTTAGRRQTEALVPSSNNSISNAGENVNRNSGEERSVGAAAADFTGKQGYYDLLTDENSQRDRFDDVRTVEVPKKDAQGRTVSESAGNIYGSALTPDSFIPTIEKLVQEGALSHDVLTNEKAMESAAQDIVTDGVHKTLADLEDAAEKGRTSANDVARAALLYQFFVEIEDDKAQQIAADAVTCLSKFATSGGQSVQLFSIFRNLTPDGQVRTIQNDIKAYARRARNLGVTNLDYAVPGIDDPIFNEFREASEEYRNAKTPEDKEAARQRMGDAQDAVYKSVAARIPSKFKDKWNAWRYMAMLGNVKTQVRNVAGNLAFMPYTDAKRVMGAAMEKLIPQDKRTKAVVGLSKNDQQLRNWAKEDARTADVHEALEYSAKLGDDNSGAKIGKNRRIFDNDILEGARKLTEAVPAKTDMLFKNREYTEALAGFIKARGYSHADIEAGNVNDSVLNEGRAYAIQEAMKATFNDCNAFSDFFANTLRYKGNNPVGKVLNTMAEGVLPFRRTPANIVVRMVENSPANIARSVVNMATKVRTGEMSAATAIDQMAAGLTGTGAMALGYFLAKGICGIRLRGSNVDEDEERQGHQAYSIESSVNGKEYSYTIDWAAPANLPLFVGANIYELFEGNGMDTSVSGFTSFVYSMRNMFEPMLSLSCLSSLNDIIESAKYAEDGSALYAVAASAATSYFTQGIPSLLRQAYQASQKTKQQTFANSADPLIRDLQRTAANIPFIGGAFQTDKVDEWGEEESRGNLGKRIFDAFFNPGTGKEIDTGALEQEITRLNGQGESVSPPDIPKTISYTDAEGSRHQNQRLTEEEWGTLRTVQGQTAAEVLNSLINSKDYAALTDEQKAEAFALAYDYAREKGRTAALAGYDGMDSWMEGIDGDESGAIIRKVATASFTDAFEAMTAAWSRGSDDAGAVEDLEAAYQVYSGLTSQQRKLLAENAAGRVADCIAAMKAGVNAETFTGLYQTYYDISKSDTKPTEKANEWAYALQRAVENRTITAKQRDVLKENMTISSGYAVATEKFDAMAESGLSAAKTDYVTGLMAGIKPESGYTDVRPVQQAEAIAGSSLTESEKAAVMKIYMSDAQDENLDQMIALGFDVEDYAKAYRIYSDASGDGKKARTIAKYQELFGVSYATAKAIYEIYG